MPYRHLIAPLLCVFALSSLARAGTESDGKELKTEVPPIVEPLAKGTNEVELLGGYFHSPIFAHGGDWAEFDYAGADLRLGRVLTDPMFADTFLKGNVEMLLDVLGDGVANGAGTYLVGGSLELRYNFLASRTVIPYIEIGGGGLHSDAVEDPDQRLIGGDFEFLLNATLGIRFMLNDRWSFHVEGGYQHISNADTASRNLGVNAIGGRLGLGYAF